jgi:NADH:ubiquinone oxidoreductase subunit E
MDEAIGHYPPDQKRSASLPLLHLWQEHFGYITDDAVTWIAAKLGLQPINILELVSFIRCCASDRLAKHISASVARSAARWPVVIS